MLTDREACQMTRCLDGCCWERSSHPSLLRPPPGLMIWDFRLAWADAVGPRTSLAWAFCRACPSVVAECTRGSGVPHWPWAVFTYVRIVNLMLRMTSTEHEAEQVKLAQSWGISPKTTRKSTSVLFFFSPPFQCHVAGSLQLQAVECKS